MTNIEKIRHCFEQQVGDDTACAEKGCDKCDYSADAGLFDIYVAGYTEALRYGLGDLKRTVRKLEGVLNERFKKGNL